MEKEELERLRKSYITTRNIYLLIAIIIMGWTVYISLNSRIPTFLFIALTILIIFYIFIVGSKKNKFVSAYKKVVMPLALKQVMTDAVFDDGYTGILNAFTPGWIKAYANINAVIFLKKL